MAIGMLQRLPERGIAQGKLLPFSFASHKNSQSPSKFEKASFSFLYMFVLSVAALELSR